MNSIQIKWALERNTFTKKTFCGVFAADEMPKLDTFPCGFVANTDPSTEPGTTGLVFTFLLVKKENFLIVMAIRLSIMVNPLRFTMLKQ